MKNRFFFFALSIIFLSACSKSDNSGSAPDCSITAANIAGSYKITAIAYTVPGFPAPIDGMTLLQPCQKDDIYVLNANGTLNYNDAGVVCDPAGNYTGTWSLTGNQIKIDTQTFTIISFDCLKLVGKGSDLNTPGDEGIVTFTKQ